MKTTLQKSKFGTIKEHEVLDCVYDSIKPSILALTGMFSATALPVIGEGITWVLIAYTPIATFVLGFLTRFAMYLGRNSEGKPLKTETK